METAWAKVALTKIAVILLLSAANLAVLIFYGAAAGDLLRFLLTILAACLLPGLGLLHWLDKTPAAWYRFPLALTVGICFDILIYISLSAAHVWFLIYPLLAIIVFSYLIRGGMAQDYRLLVTGFKKISPAQLGLAAAFSLVLLGFTVLFMFVPAPLPGVQAVVYHVDIPWHLGNAAEILHHWYPQDPRLAGNPFNYHIFFYVWLAFLSRLGNIGLPVLYLRLITLLLIYLLAANAYFTGSRWYNCRRAGWWHLAAVFLCGTVLLSLPYNIFLRNLYISPTFLLAVIIMLPLLLEIKHWWQNSDYRRLILISVLAFGVSGAKGSFMPVIIAALFVTSLYQWHSNRGTFFLLAKPIKRTSPCWTCWKKESQQKERPLVGNIVLLASTAGVFGLVFGFIFRGTGSEGINIQPLQIITATARYQQYEAWLSQTEPLWVLFSFIPIYLLLFFGFRLWPLGRELVYGWRKRGQLPAERIFLLSLFFISLVPGYLLAYRGSSQYYYLFVGYSALNLLAAGYLADLFGNVRLQWRQCLVAILLLLSLADTAVTLQYQHYLNQKFAGIRNQPLTPGVYRALSYVRLNTPPDSIVASYRSFWLNEEDARFFYYSAFSERRLVVEGWAYMSAERQLEAQSRYQDIQRLFVTRSPAIARDIIRQYEVDYILVNRKLRQRLKFPLDGVAEKVYGNQDMEVYRCLP